MLEQEVAQLDGEGERPLPVGLGTVEARQPRQPGLEGLDQVIEAMVIPPDLQAALDGNPSAAAQFDGFSPSARRAFLWWIKSAKRPATRAQRVTDTVWRAERGMREPGRRP